MVRDAGLAPRGSRSNAPSSRPSPTSDQLQRQVKALRRLGFGFAVDDAGAGYASFALIAALRPTVIKIDRDIAPAIAHDDAKQALVEAFVSFGRRIGARLVAEGIEQRADLAAVDALGVDFGQGYLLGRPAPSRRAAGHRGLAGPPRPGRRRAAAFAAPSRTTPRRGRLPGERQRPRGPLRVPSGVTDPTTRPPTPDSSTTRISRRSPRSIPTADHARRSSGIASTAMPRHQQPIGRRWPSNLLRDPRVSMAINDHHDGERWVGITGIAEPIHDQAVAQADIAEMARRYNADDPAEAERLINERFERQERIRFRIVPRPIHDHLD